MVACLNGAENAVTLPPTSTWPKDPGEGPNNAQKGTQYETKDNLSPYHRRGSALGKSTCEERSDRAIAPSSIGDAGGALSWDHQALPQSPRDPRRSVQVLSYHVCYTYIRCYQVICAKSENITQSSIKALKRTVRRLTSFDLYSLHLQPRNFSSIHAFWPAAQVLRLRGIAPGCRA